MKKYIKYLWLLLLSVSISSCEDYYDTPLTQDISIDDIFADEVTALTFLDGAYDALPHRHATAGSDGAGLKKFGMYKLHVTFLGDEGISSRTTPSLNYPYQLGTLTASVWNTTYTSTDTQKLEDFQTGRYYYIRRCLIFLENIANIPNVSASYVTQRTAEAKLVMAMLYFEMFFRYGSVPIVSEVLTGSEGEIDIIGTRPSLSDFVAQLDEWCVEGMNNLPDTYDAANQGRLTRASAYFFRSKLWLWAASPLFNKETTAHWAQAVGHSGREDLNYSTAGYVDLWGKVEEYTKDAIDFCHSAGYSLVSVPSGGDIDPLTGVANAANIKAAYRTITYETHDVGNTECIMFTRRAGNTSSSIYDVGNMPYGAIITSTTKGTRGQGGPSPTQTFINMYRNKDGSMLAEDPFNLTDELREFYAKTENPWEGLEDRFFAQVMYHGQQVQGLTGIYTYDSDATNYGTTCYWATGYSSRKFIDDECYHVGTAADHTYDLVDVVMRLPELYFNYAEALLNQGKTADALEWIKPTMRRGNLPVESMTFPTDADTAWDWFVREKAIEYAYEHHRYWDLKRWLRGDLIAQKKIGMMPKYLYESETNEDGSNKSYLNDYAANYSFVGDDSDPGWVFRDCYDWQQYLNYTFDSKQYLWPIMQTEILKDCGWVQNPGYEL